MLVLLLQLIVSAVASEVTLPSRLASSNLDIPAKWEPSRAIPIRAYLHSGMCKSADGSLLCLLPTLAGEVTETQLIVTTDFDSPTEDIVIQGFGQRTLLAFNGKMRLASGELDS